MYCIAAKSKEGIKFYATFDPVFDSLMIKGKSKDIVKFKTKKEAKLKINTYQGFQRTLINYKVEKL